MAFSKALIVDDSKLARVTLKKKLEAHGLEVIAAESANEAYELLLQVQPDIVFMDHLMPEVDGFEATQHLRAQGVKTPIIMCTGKEHDGYLDEALAVGADYILGKPPADDGLAAVLTMTFTVRGDAAANDVMTVDDFDLDELDQVLESVSFEDIEPASDALLPDDDIPLLIQDEANDLPLADVDAEAELLSREPAAIDVAEDWAQALLDEDNSDAVFIEDEVTAVIPAALAEVEEPVIAEDAVLPLTAGVSRDDINVLIDDALARNRTDLLQEFRQQLAPLQAQVDALPVAADLPPPLPSGLAQQEVEMLVHSAVDASRAVILDELNRAVGQLQQQIDNTPIAASAGQDDKELLVRLEEILHPRMIELKSSLLSDVQRKLQADRESGFDELLELRLNVLLAERMAAFEQRLRDMEEAQTDMVAVPADGIPVADNTQSSRDRFRMSEKVTKHLDQLIEENAAFALRIQQIRQLAIGAASAAGAGLLITLVHYFLS